MQSHHRSIRPQIYLQSYIMQPYTPDDIDPSPPARTANTGHLRFAEDKGGLWSSGNSTNVSLSVNPREETLYRTITRHFKADIDKKYADLMLIVCGFVGGLVDGLSFNAWGSFSSMQTGTYPPISSPHQANSIQGTLFF